VDELRVVGETRHGAVDELSFVLRRDRRDVPGALWRPDDGDVASPVVLLGHGGSGHKRSERHARMAPWFAAHGIASLAIDGPFHGDRAADGDGPLGYQDRAVREGATSVHERMRRDWLDTLEAVGRAGWVDEQNVAFLGMSMGTRYGLAVCASLKSRLRCAVIGKFGLTQTDRLPQHLAANRIVTTAAESIHAPVLQHVQWDDEIFRRQGQLDLFDLLPSPDKQLRARTGAHGLTRPNDETAWREHVAAHLNPR
jgi:dienelactone hydrolase